MTTATVQLYEFLPLILPHAQGCPEPLAEQKLRLAVIEWCERTRCWRQIVTQTIQTTGTSSMIVPPYGAIHEIEWAYFDEVRLTPAQFSDIDHSEDWAANRSIPSWITQAAPDRIALFPPPAAPGRLKISMFLKPRSGNEFGGNAAQPFEDAFNDVPEFLFTQHAEPLSWGALARILEVPAQDFSDPAMAQEYRARFKERMEGKTSYSMTGQHRAPRRTRYHDF